MTTVISNLPLRGFEPSTSCTTPTHLALMGRRIRPLSHGGFPKKEGSNPRRGKLEMTAVIPLLLRKFIGLLSRELLFTMI